MTTQVSDPILVAPSPTPFKPNDTVDYDAVARNTERWLKTPLTGFVLNSENGEEQFLSEAERLEIVRTVHRARGGQKLLIGGVDSPSVTDSLRVAEALAEAGADMVRVRIPRYGVEVGKYFAEVVPRSPVPVVVIHQMAPGQFMGGAEPVGAPAEVIGEAVSRDNVFGYIASGNIRFESRARLFISQAKRFWVGNGILLLPGAAVGANGGCMMLGNVAPKECLEVIRLVNEGQLQPAQEIQRRVIHADWHILSRGAAGIKHALGLQGFEMGPPRSPLPGLTDDAKREIETSMREAGLV